MGFAFLALLLSDIVYLKYDFDERENNALRSIADSITVRTQREFAAVDQMLAGLSKLEDRTLPVLTRSNMFGRNHRALGIDSVLRRYPYFEQLYWLDATGDLRAMWTTTDQQYSRVPLADREYFRKIREGKSHWIQPHYSRGTSEFMVAYSTAASFRFSPEAGDTSLLAAVDFLPRALVDIYLPDGYGYAVIDGSGRVLFHSILNRSLNENLFAECNSLALRDMVEVGATGPIRARYWETDVRIHGTPMRIHEQQWYLVVYSDQQIAADRKSGTLIMSMVLYLLFFLPVLVGYTVFLFVRDRHLAWMWFQPDRIREYVVLTAGFVLASVLCLAGSLAIGNLPLAMMIGCVVPHAGLLTAFYWLDSCVYPATRLSYKGRTRFSFVAQRRMVAGLHIAALAFYMYMVLTNTKVVSSTATDDSHAAFAVIAFLAASFGAVAIAPVRRMREDVREWITKQTAVRTPQRWYVAMLTSLSLLLGIVPMLLFFRVSHDVHAIASDRVAQASLHAYMEQRDEKLRTAHHDRAFSPGDAAHSIEAFYRSDTTDLYFDRTRHAHLDTERLDTRYTMFNDSLLNVLMLPLSQGSSFLRAHLKGNSMQEPIPFGADTLYFHTEPGFFRLLPGGGTTIPLAMLCVVLLLVMYQTIDFGTRRLFQTGVVRLHWKYDPLSEGSCLYIWTTDDEAAEFRSLRPPDVDIAALEFPDAEWVHRTLKAALARQDRTGQLVIDHFDYRSEDPPFNILKLELLEHLLITHGRQVCLICSVDPEYYLLEREAGRQSVGIRERWKRVLNMMVHVYPSTLLPRGSENSRLDGHGARNAGAEKTVREGEGTKAGSITGIEAGASAWRPRAEELRRILDEECVHTGMHAVVESAGQLVDSAGITSREGLLTWIGIHFKPFYQALWTTFTKKEQLVLYHLAQDGFVPYRTQDVLQQLMQRGIVFMDPALRVFSETFRLFILSAKTYEQIRHWEEEEPASFWSRVKHPVLVVVTIVAAALLYSKPDYFNSTLAVIAALAGAIPLVLRLRGFLTSGKIEQ